VAITQCVPTSFKIELLKGTHVFGSDTFKIALYLSSADLGPSTTVYTTAGEISGTAYSAGGATLTGVAPTSDGSVALTDFSDITWSAATITARGALIYNSSKSNKVVTILDFGSDRIKAAADFKVEFPSADQHNAIVRIV
jgi:hypothetical protein